MNPAGEAISVFSSLLLLLLYVFFSFCLYRLGKALNDDRGWWAWIPILQVFYMLRLARISYWWFIGLVVPFVNVAVAAYVWAQIAIRRGRKWWVGALMIVPVIDLAILAYLAFSNPEEPAS